LLLSSACVILTTMKAVRTSVFTHRGLSPLQFTPMSGAHNALEPTPVGAGSSARGQRYESGVA
jgi:hypothetical protein